MMNYSFWKFELNGGRGYNVLLKRRCGDHHCDDRRCDYHCDHWWFKHLLNILYDDHHCDDQHCCCQCENLLNEGGDGFLLLSNCLMTF